MKKIGILGAFCLTVILMFVAVPVQAVPVPITGWVGQITSDHMDGTGGAGTGPFGKVELTLFDSTSLSDPDVLVDDVLVKVSMYGTNKFMASGAGAGYNFLFDGTDIVLADFIGTGLTFAGSSGGSTLHADGTGNWDFGVGFTGQGNGNGDALPGPIEFTVLNAAIEDLIAGNGTHLFAIDMFSGQTQNTGMVDVSTGGPPTTGIPIPEPTTILLLGLGLVGLAGIRRGLKK